MEIRKITFSQFSSGNIVYYMYNAWLVTGIWRNSKEIDVTDSASQNLSQRLRV